MSYLPMIVAATFVLLGLWHFQMATRGKMVGGAVPTVDGEPLFVPSPRATILVGVALLLCAWLVLGQADMVWTGLPAVLLQWACVCLALGLALRAVGDFRYVGFFKKVRGTRFARLDTLIYSPLCLLLSVGVFLGVAR